MATAWKHIGLHGHSVGTFAVDSDGIQWKSALTASEDVSTSRSIPAKAVEGADWTVFGRSGHIRLRTDGKNNLKHEMRFDGFPPTDYEKLKSTLQQAFDVDLQKHVMSASGASFGNSQVDGRNLVFRQAILEDADEEGEEFEPRDGPELMSLDLTEVSQCVLPGNNRNEIELQFPESDTVEAGTDQLVALRFYVPPEADADPNDPTPAELLQQRIMKTANIKNTTGNVLVEFDETNGTFLTPRGRYNIELYDWFLRMRGNKYDYKIKYDDISRLFLLPKPDDVHMAFVIALDKPIRQGQQRYQYLVLQTTKEQAEVTVNLDEETLKKDYNGDLQPTMKGSLSNLVAKTFKVIARKKVFIPGKFANVNQHACVKCALRANEGHLYPLEKQFIFIHKPPVLIRFDEVESVEFQRYAGGQGSTRNFDLCVTLNSANKKEYVFSGIDRGDYTALYNFLEGKRIRIKNLEGAGMEEAEPTEPVYNEDEIYGTMGMGEMEDESEDESYGEGQGDEGSESGSEDDMDDDEMGSEVDEDMDSDLEEAREKVGIKKKKKKKDASDNESEPKAKETKEKKKKRPSPEVSVEKKKGKKKKKKKDPNAPKRAMTSYILFANAKRAEIKAGNPDMGFGELNKLIGSTFKGLSEEERKEWDEKAAEDKARYEREMENYSAPEEEEESDEDEKPKKKKAKKDPNKPKGSMSAYNFFMTENRAKIKEDNPDASFAEIAKLVGEKYKSLTEEEKKPYDEKAAEDKIRYKKEMESYVPPEEKAKKEKKAKPKVEKKAAPESDDSDSDDSDEKLVVDDSDDSSDDSD